MRAIVRIGNQILEKMADNRIRNFYTSTSAAGDGKMGVAIFVWLQ